VLIKLYFGVCCAVNLCSDPENKLKIYQENFEKAYLDATAQFYRMHAERYLQENGVHEYMKYAQQKLEEEEKRAQRYLENSKDSKSLDKVCVRVLAQYNYK
jgi:cullin-5